MPDKGPVELVMKITSSRRANAEDWDGRRDHITFGQFFLYVRFRPDGFA
jgi:hypothetical protein